MKILRNFLALALLCGNLTQSNAAFSELDKSQIQNFVNNGGAEAGLAGAFGYADAAAIEPVDGVGGSFTGATLTRTTSSPLSGNASFLLTKDASNRQGMGFGIPFSIPLGARSHNVSIGFNYLASSGFTASNGSETDNSDVEIYIYDITNSKLVSNLTTKVLTSKGYSASYSAQFQASPDSSEYRLIFHIATTSATAWTVRVDDIESNIKKISVGSIVTDWKSYTPIFSASIGTINSSNFWWRRIGDSVQIRGLLDCSGGSGSEAQIGLPLVSIDSTKNSSLFYVGNIQLDSANNTSNNIGSSYSVVAEPGNSYVGFSYRGTVSGGLVKQGGSSLNGQISSWDFTVPISGWQASSSIGESDGRDVGAVIGLSAPYAAGSNAAVVLDTVIKDTHGAYSIITGGYTVPVAGDYKLSLNSTVTASAGTLYIVKNAVNISYLMYVTVTAINSGSVTVPNCKAGDVLYVYTDTGLTFTATGGLYQNYLSIEKLSGSATVSPSEKIQAKYYVSANYAYTAGNAIVFDTKVIDTHNAFNPSTGQFTCPVSKTYAVSATEQMASSTQHTLYAQNLTSSDSTVLGVAASGTNNSASGATIISCKAGEIIQTSLDASLTITGGGNKNTSISIHGI